MHLEILVEDQSGKKMLDIWPKTISGDSTMEDYRLLIDLHKRSKRLGPGGDAETEEAVRLARIDRGAALKVADIGCGTGASTLVLARLLNARITAVDFIGDFLEVLEDRAEREGLSGRITTVTCSMDQLPFEDESLDVIWSEGAIYSMGFENGVSQWNRFLKKGGLLVVSEITWTTSSRPLEIQTHWDNEYPEIDLASSKTAVLEKHGYSPTGYFVLPEHCWLDNYYGPLQEGFDEFLRRNGNSDEARDLVAAEQREIDLYRAFKDCYSYGVYIARKV